MEGSGYNIELDFYFGTIANISFFSGGKCIRVQLPEEATVLRSIPWTSRSMSTIEYTEDLRLQAEAAESKDPADQQHPKRRRVDSICPSILDIDHPMGGATSSNSACRVGSFISSFHSHVAHNGSNSEDFMPRCLPHMRPEMEDELPPEHAMGHRMYVVGMRPRQYFYCGLCYGYSGNRVQKLAMTCQPAKVVPKSIGNLMTGIHPTDGTPLDTLPRRMSKRDTGFQTWCGTGNPGATFNAFVLEGDETVHPIGFMERPLDHHPTHVEGGESF